MKPVNWLGSSRKDIKAFDADARRIAGVELSLVQRGLEPTDWKSMSAIAVGVKEIRIHTAVESRVLYVAKYVDTIYVLHAFIKKTQKTEQRDINIAKTRLSELVEKMRKARKEK